MEKQLLDWCVKYVYDLVTTDDGNGMIEMVCESLGVDEGTLMDTFETLSQTHKIYLDEATPGE